MALAQTRAQFFKEFLTSEHHFALQLDTLLRALKVKLANPNPLVSAAAKEWIASLKIILKSSLSGYHSLSDSLNNSDECTRGSSHSQDDGSAPHIACVYERLLEYPDLLARLLSITSPLNADHKSIVDALSHARAVAAYVDYAFIESERAYLLRSIRAGLPNTDSAFLAATSGEESLLFVAPLQLWLLEQGSLQLHDTLSLLFNNRLVILHPLASEAYTSICSHQHPSVVPLAQVRVYPLSDRSFLCVFQDGGVMELQAPSSAAALRWSALPSAATCIARPPAPPRPTGGDPPPGTSRQAAVADASVPAKEATIDKAAPAKPVETTKPLSAPEALLSPSSKSPAPMPAPRPARGTAGADSVSPSASHLSPAPSAHSAGMEEPPASASSVSSAAPTPVSSASVAAQPVAPACAEPAPPQRSQATAEVLSGQSQVSSVPAAAASHSVSTTISAISPPSALPAESLTPSVAAGSVGDGEAAGAVVSGSQSGGSFRRKPPPVAPRQKSINTS